MPTEELVLHAQLRDELTRPLNRVRGEIAATAREAQSIDRASTAGAGGLSRLESAGSRLRTSMSGLNDKLRDASSWLGDKLASAAKTGAIAFVALTSVVGVFGLKAASQFQTSQLAFETLLGSAQKGKALFTELQQINLKTPFQLGDLTSSTQVLLRYGVAADQVVPIIKSLSDIAATSDHPTENLSRLALAIGQVSSQGRVLGQDARQLAEAGFNPYAVLADKLGKTTEQVRKLGEQGKLSSKDLIDALIAESNGLERFQGGAAKMNQTLMGQLSNLWDALKIGLAGAATPLTTQLTAQMPQIVSVLSGLVGTIGPPLFTLLGGLAQVVLRLLPSVAPIVTAIANGLVMLMNAAGPALTALQPLGGQIGQAITAFAVALTPLMPDLVKLLGGLLLILPDMIHLLTNLLPLLDVMVRVADGLLQYDAVRQVLAGLLTVLLGYRVLSSVVGSLSSFAGGLRGVAAAERDVNAAQGAGGGGAFGGRAARGAIGGLGLLTQLQGATEGQSAAGDAAFIGSGALAGSAFGPYGTLAGGTLTAGYVGARRLGEFLGLLGDVPSNMTRVNRMAAMAGGGVVPPFGRVRDFAVRGPDSGHLDGRALDIIPPNPRRFVSEFNALGGFAAQHGNHVHAEVGDMAPSWPDSTGARYVIAFNAPIYGVDDLEAAVAEGVRRAEREKKERGRSTDG